MLALAVGGRDGRWRAAATACGHGRGAVYRPTPRAAVPWPAMPRADLSVPHRALTRADVPDPRADFEAIVAFAYGFDGYARFGLEGCGELANRTLATYLSERRLPDDLDALRACLYFEARRWIVLEREPDTRARLYVGALLDHLADRLDEQVADAAPLPLAGPAGPT
jgi:hypothetical protein